MLIADDKIMFQNTNFELLMTEAFYVEDDFLDSKFLAKSQDEDGELVSIRSLLG